MWLTVQNEKAIDRFVVYLFEDRYADWERLGRPSGYRTAIGGVSRWAGFFGRRRVVMAIFWVAVTRRTPTWVQGHPAMEHLARQIGGRSWIAVAALGLFILSTQCGAFLL